MVSQIIFIISGIIIAIIGIFSLFLGVLECCLDGTGEKIALFFSMAVVCAGILFIGLAIRG